MEQTLGGLLGLATIGSIAGLVGGLIFLVKKDWATVLAKYAVPFAAGILLSVSLLHLLPEAVQEIDELGFVVVLASLISAFLFEQFFAQLHHHEDRKGTMAKATIPLVFIGDTIHNFIDGVTIASAYLVEPSFGLIVALSTFLHETPHEIGDFGVFISRGWSRQKTFGANFLSALATFPGALLVFFFLQDAHESIATLLAVSAGIFLYLGASDFLPEVSEESDSKSKVKKLALLILGVLLMYLLRSLTPEH